VAAVATAIRNATGLTVVVTAGSSVSDIEVADALAGAAPHHVELDQEWVELGVAVRILNSIDRVSLLLLVIVLLVCSLFVANAVTAEVATRSAELAVLSCVGWRRRSIFLATLGEVTVTGAMAGAAGVGVALALQAVLHLPVSAARSLLVMPVSVLLALGSGLWPAWKATTIEPLRKLRPPARQRPRLAVRRPLMLSVVNVLRHPARTLVAVLGLGLGMSSLILLISVRIGFQGEVVGSVLGNVVDIRVRSTEVLSAVLACPLGISAVADALWISLSERAAEQSVLQVFGWSNGTITKTILAEGLLLGVLGGVLGAIGGVAAAAAVSVGIGAIASALAAVGAGAMLLVLVAIGAPLMVYRRKAPLIGLGQEDT
jgi:ABC-type antimicrobial peptide transport system permease subunit